MIPLENLAQAAAFFYKICCAQVENLQKFVAQKLTVTGGAGKDLLGDGRQYGYGAVVQK